MDVVRIHIFSWTASFRYPRFMIGMQPTLKIPPLSTIYGLLSAVAGEPITPFDISIGFIFESSTNYVDLELIYEIKDLKTIKTNIIRRENLYNCHLYLYVKDVNNKVLDFREPYYPLLLGRSTDLATVSEIKNIKLQKKKNTRLGHTIIPYVTNLVKGAIQSLPVYMTVDIPRKPIGIRPFVILEDWISEYPDPLWYDSELDSGIWFHNVENLDLNKG